MLMEALLLTPYLAIASSLALAVNRRCRLLQPARATRRGLYGLSSRSIMASLAQTIRHFWSAMTGQDSARRAGSAEVIVHDPGAERPHDLDDPFFDPKVQSRMAGVIADNAKKHN